jgi:hypothetical protein
MNKRIEDLMYHSGLTAQGCWDEMDDYDKQAIEKFAELIVKECATKANATALDLRIRPELDARKYVGDGILKLFGVER